MRGFTKLKKKKKNLLKISAVYLIGNPEICQDPPSCGQDDQTLLRDISTLHLCCPLLIIRYMNYRFQKCDLLHIKLSDIHITSVETWIINQITCKFFYNNGEQMLQTFLPTSIIYQLTRSKLLSIVYYQST